MNKDGKLSPELSQLYFSPTRPMFELYDLEADPRRVEEPGRHEGGRGRREAS